MTATIVLGLVNMALIVALVWIVREWQQDRMRLTNRLLADKGRVIIKEPTEIASGRVKYVADEPQSGVKKTYEPIETS